MDTVHITRLTACTCLIVQIVHGRVWGLTCGGRSVGFLMMGYALLSACDT